VVYPGNGQSPQNWGQQQPSYQGFGLYDQQPGGEPPKRKNLVMIFSILAIVVIIGAVVTIVLLNRGGGSPSADNPPATTTSSSSTKPPTSKSTTATSSTKPGDVLQPHNKGWTVIKNDKAKLIYEVPPAWTPLPSGSLSSKALPDAAIYFPATVGEYQCGGKGYSRGGVGAGTIAKSDLSQAATNIAKAFGAEFYNSGTATVTTGAAKPINDVAGPNGKVFTGAQVDATIATTGNDCLATKGKVSVLVVDDGTDKYQFFVVNGDLDGGPATPPWPAETDLQKIIDSARGY
jgi:hypothetical protein